MISGTVVLNQIRIIRLRPFEFLVASNCRIVQRCFFEVSALKNNEKKPRYKVVCKAFKSFLLKNRKRSKKGRNFKRSFHRTIVQSLATRN